MSISFQFCGKAALVAAFLFLNSGSTALGATPDKTVVAKNTAKLQEQKIDQAKKKITSLLLLKQRSQALDLIQELAKTISTPDLQKKISQLKLVVLSSFLTSDAQDYFELASGQYLSEGKQALKNSQRCLSIDPEHFLCQWAEAKANSKSNSRYIAFMEKLKTTALDVPELKPLILSLNKAQPEFVNLQLDSSRKNELYDSQILTSILEFDRSLLAKNYLLAKESLDQLQQIAPDYIDIIIMRAQLHRYTYADEPIENLLNVSTVYKKKCEAVSPEIARKYFFDIDFCRRTLE